MTPTRDRKKPVVIEAIQWDGTAEGATPIIDWILSSDGTARFVDYDGPTHLDIQTLEGVIKASAGDFIIRGVANEFYPCKPEIFATTYEVAIERL
jgi:hypothetical protein